MNNIPTQEEIDEVIDSSYLSKDGLMRLAVYVSAIEQLSITHGLCNDEEDEEKFIAVNDKIAEFTRYKIGNDVIQAHLDKYENFGIQYAEIDAAYLKDLGRVLIFALLSGNMSDNDRDVMLANMANTHFNEFLENESISAS